MNSDQLYEEKDWRGKTLLVCPLCKADTFDKIVMLKHLVDAHDSELALVKLLDLEKGIPAAKKKLPAVETPENGGNDVFEVELVETGSAVDAQENEHNTYKVKE